MRNVFPDTISLQKRLYIQVEIPFNPSKFQLLVEITKYSDKC